MCLPTRVTGHIYELHLAHAIPPVWTCAHCTCKLYSSISKYGIRIRGLMRLNSYCHCKHLRRRFACTLVIDSISLHASKSCVPTSPYQIVFVKGNSTPRHRHTKKGGSVLVTNCNVIERADAADVITRVRETCCNGR